MVQPVYGDPRQPGWQALHGRYTPSAPPPPAPAPQPRYSHSGRVLRDPGPLLAHEILRGELAQRAAAHSGRPPPTAVLVHGIMGSRRNLSGFARRLLEEHPGWQVVLVDLRCHGDSAALAGSLAEPHTVHSAAGDVLRLLAGLRLFPELLVGHSFGGKVVMAMAERWGAHQTAGLPRPVQVWALDSLPGPILAGGVAASGATAADSPPTRRASGADHPADLIAALRSIPTPVRGRGEVVSALQGRGFSQPVAAWAAGALRPFRASDPGGPLVWGPDLAGIAAMYADYESADLWPWVRARLQGVTLHLVRAQRSAFEWPQAVLAGLAAAGGVVHDLPASGHWVHADNPAGLARILAPALLEATPAWLLPADASPRAPAKHRSSPTVEPMPGRVTTSPPPVSRHALRPHTDLLAPLAQRASRPGLSFGGGVGVGLHSRHVATPAAHQPR